LRQHQARVERAERLLAAFSYREVLKRGFALVRDGDGHPLRAAATVAGGMPLDIEFADGRVAATADGGSRPDIVISQTVVTKTIAAEAAPQKPKPRAKSSGEGSSGQGSLFGS
jgi:exodeoxyribonuclease VII large subunit